MSDFISLPRCCERLGLDFGNGAVCPRHQTEQERRYAEALDRRAGHLGLERVEERNGSPIEWPYGLGRPGAIVADRVALLDWMEANRVRPAKVSGKRLDANFLPCLHWLREGICRDRGLCRDRYAPWMDHTSGWVRADGVRLFVSQPYGLSDEDRAALALLDAEPDMRVQIDEGGWYGADYFVSVWAGEEAAAFAMAKGWAEFALK